jgi:beta-lactamase superfamily II metal-dependent hydrolase
MEVNITKKTNLIYARNKKTNERMKVVFLDVGQRKFYSSSDDWGIWHDYSKRGEWEIYTEI